MRNSENISHTLHRAITITKYQGTTLYKPSTCHDVLQMFLYFVNAIHYIQGNSAIQLWSYVADDRKLKNEKKYKLLDFLDEFLFYSKLCTFYFVFNFKILIVVANFDITTSLPTHFGIYPLHARYSKIKPRSSNFKG